MLSVIVSIVSVGTDIPDINHKVCYLDLVILVGCVCSKLCSLEEHVVLHSVLCSYFVAELLFVDHFSGVFYFLMAANVDWASSAEEQEKLITKVLGVTLFIRSLVPGTTIFL
jgi:hypothetical protein